MMYATTKYWCGLINDSIDCGDVVALPAADTGDSIITTTGRDVDAKPSMDYG